LYLAAILIRKQHIEVEFLARKTRFDFFVIVVLHCPHESTAWFRSQVSVDGTPSTIVFWPTTRRCARRFEQMQVGGFVAHGASGASLETMAGNMQMRLE